MLNPASLLKNNMCIYSYKNKICVFKKWSGSSEDFNSQLLDSRSFFSIHYNNQIHYIISQMDSCEFHNRVTLCNARMKVCRTDFSSLLRTHDKRAQ